MTWSASVADRTAGVMWGQACGDALGAGYEFGPPLAADVEVRMIGGGGFGWAPGEWTDDTQMAVPVLEAAEAAVSVGGTLMDHLDSVAQAWVEWAVGAADVGNQTRSVLAAVRAEGPATAEALLAASRRLHELTGHTAGNGSLMRTSPVALAMLGHDDLSDAARLVSSLTHYDADAGDACVLWCEAIAHAVLTGELDVLVGLDRLPEDRRDLWVARVVEAEAVAPVWFERNGWVVHAFQAAWSSLTRAVASSDDPSARFRNALEGAVRAGRDTDTVAAITGQLAGAAFGESAVPDGWRDVVHGWPGWTGQALADRGRAVAEAAVVRLAGSGS
jgi:ADP-ribosylglycohydrolase